MSDGPEHDERLCDWVDERLPAGELERLEADLRVDGELRAAAESYRQTVDVVRAALREPDARADLADRILARVEAESRPSPSRPRAFSPWLASAAAAAVLALAWLGARAIQDSSPESVEPVAAGAPSADGEVDEFVDVAEDETRTEVAGKAGLARTLAVGDETLGDDARSVQRLQLGSDEGPAAPDGRVGRVEQQRKAVTDGPTPDLELGAATVADAQQQVDGETPETLRRRGAPKRGDTAVTAGSLVYLIEWPAAPVDAGGERPAGEANPTVEVSGLDLLFEPSARGLFANVTPPDVFLLPTAPAPSDRDAAVAMVTGGPGLYTPGSGDQTLWIDGDDAQVRAYLTAIAPTVRARGGDLKVLRFADDDSAQSYESLRTRILGAAVLEEKDAEKRPQSGVAADETRPAGAAPTEGAPPGVRGAWLVLRERAADPKQSETPTTEPPPGDGRQRGETKKR